MGVPRDGFGEVAWGWIFDGPRFNAKDFDRKWGAPEGRGITGPEPHFIKFF